MSQHGFGEICGGCNNKLLTAHPRLRSWFIDLKKRYPNVHVAWAFRDEASQNAAYRDGKSTKIWPNSKHNHMEDGKPCSLALDLFLIDEDGVAQWPPLWYARVNAENETNREPILWAGLWKKFKETCHFYLKSDDENSAAA